MNCEYVTDRLPELASDPSRLESGVADALRAHIAACDACAAEWSIVSSLATSLPAVPAGMHARIASAVAARPAATRGAWFGARQLTIAATVAVALVGGGVALQQVASNPGVVTAASTNDSLATSASAPAANASAYVTAAPVLGSTSVLPDMTEAQLEALLAKLGS
jgi:hypothetical protein